MKLSCYSVLCSLVLLSTLSHAGQGNPGSQGPGWEFSVGVTARQFGDLSMRSGSTFQNQNFGLFVPGFQADLNPAGPADQNADRTYADGFVRIDAGTAIDGLTGYWGFQDASQISGDTISFQTNAITNTVSSTNTQIAALARDYDTGTRFGPELEMAYRLRTTETFVLRGVVGFSWTNPHQLQSGSTFREDQQSLTNRVIVEDTYSLGGIIPPLAPYTGAEGGPGPLISNLPISRLFLPNGVPVNDDAVLTNQIFNGVDLDIYTVSFGLEARHEIAPSLSILGGVGLAMNLVNARTEHFEELRISQNGGTSTRLQQYSDNNRSVKASWGYFLKSGLALQLNENLFLQGYARYDWNESISGSVGPGSYSMDMDAFSFGTSLLWSF